MRAGRATYPFVVSFIALTPYIAGCGKSTDTQDPGGPRTVVGTSRVAYVTEQGEMEQADDLTRYMISASVMDSGSLREISGSGQADGTFSIANVPAGSYWLKFINPSSELPPVYLYTDATNVDMGKRRLERPGLVFAKMPTLLSMSLTNLLAWNASCVLETQVATQSTRWLMASPVVSVGNDGATALTVDTTVTGSDSHSPALLDPGLGDKLTLLQLCPSPTDPSSLTVQKYATVTPPKMVDGQVASVNIAMMDVPQTQTLRVHFRRSAFAALASSVSSELQATDMKSLLLALPTLGANNYGTNDQLSEVVLYTASGMTDLDLNLAYGNPHPTSWFLELGFGGSVNAMRTAPGQSTPSRINVVLRSAYAAASGAMTTPVDGGPIVSPALALQVAGLDAATAHSGIGLTPALTWTAPQQGTADLYAVSAYYFDQTKSLWQIAATLYTTTSSITIPPGVLQAGQAYVFQVEAQSRGRTDLGAAPLRLAYPYGQAAYVSAVMQVN